LNTRRQANREHQANMRHENKLGTEERKEKEVALGNLAVSYTY
jgi:hypothetical protein